MEREHTATTGLRSSRADAFNRAAVRRCRGVAGGESRPQAGLGSSRCGCGTGRAGNPRPALRTGWQDHPRHGRQVARRRAHPAAPRFAPLLRCRSPDPRADHYQSAGALHDRRPALPYGNRPGLRNQQPEDAQRHERRHRGPDHIHFRLPAAGLRSNPGTVVARRSKTAGMIPCTVAGRADCVWHGLQSDPVGAPISGNTYEPAIHDIRPWQGRCHTDSDVHAAELQRHSGRPDRQLLRFHDRQEHAVRWSDLWRHGTQRL